jgi:hypothetical protein
MLALWLGTFAVSASPQLHRLLHPDAQSASHQCVVTQVKDHLLLSASPPVTAPVPEFQSFVLACFSETNFPGERDYRLPPSRAPPSLFSSATVVG